ncbi:13721_t:CDS:2, partial [Gigaspora margarita]
WVIDKHLAWDNLIYFAVGHIEYLSQLIQIEGYMDQDKKKGHEFNLSVDYILILKDLQKDICLIEMEWSWYDTYNQNQWTVDRIDNQVGHIKDINKKTIQDLLQCYYNFGEALSKQYNYYRDLNYGDLASQSLVANDIREQLSKDISQEALRK